MPLIDALIDALRASVAAMESADRYVGDPEFTAALDKARSAVDEYDRATVPAMIDARRRVVPIGAGRPKP